MSNLREAVIKLAHDVPELRQHLVPILSKTAGRKELEIYRDFGGFMVKYPDVDSQTYDSYLLWHRNPKTVNRLAVEAIGEWAKGHPGSNDYNGLQKFVDQYVQERTKGRFTHVSWNMKSYPD